MNQTDDQPPPGEVTTGRSDRSLLARLREAPWRVFAGTLKSDATVQNVTKDTPERLGHLLVMQGKTQTSVPEIKAGDFAAIKWWTIARMGYSEKLTVDDPSRDKPPK